MRKLIILLCLLLFSISCGVRKMHKEKKEYQKDAKQSEYIETHTEEELIKGSYVEESSSVTNLHIEVIPEAPDISRIDKPPNRRLEFIDNKGNKMSMELNPTDKLLYKSNDSIYEEVYKLEERVNKLALKQQDLQTTQTTDYKSSEKETEKTNKALGFWLYLILTIALVVLIIYKLWQKKLRIPFWS